MIEMVTLIGNVCVCGIFVFVYLYLPDPDFWPSFGFDLKSFLDFLSLT